MHKQTAAGFGNVQVVLKKALDGEQRFRVQRINAVLLEYFAQECFAQVVAADKSGGQCQVIIADDLLFGIKYLTNFHGDLRSLKEEADP